MEPVGELGDDYESAFYAVSEAYVASAEHVSGCNNRLNTARKQIEEKEKIYGSGER